jgi:hypothetical protein
MFATERFTLTAASSPLPVCQFQIVLVWIFQKVRAAATAELNGTLDSESVTPQALRKTVQRLGVGTESDVVEAASRCSDSGQIFIRQNRSRFLWIEKHDIEVTCSQKGIPAGIDGFDHKTEQVAIERHRTIKVFDPESHF